MPWPHTAALLAGGRGVRMGGAKELAALPDGRLMIDAVAAALRSVAMRLVVVGHAEALPELPHVEDLREDQGPLGGIEALLASGHDEMYLVCPCDMPRLTAAPLRALCDADPGAVAVVLRSAGETRNRPLPARLSVAALPAVRRALDEGRRAVHQLMAELTPVVIEAPRDWEPQLINMNTPEDLRRWR